MLTEPSNEAPLFLDKSSRIPKPPERALGPAPFCREILTPKGEGVAKVCWRAAEGERGKFAGICFPVAPESTGPQGDLNLFQGFLSLVWGFSWKRRSVDTL